MLIDNVTRVPFSSCFFLRFSAFSLFMRKCALAFDTSGNRFSACLRFLLQLTRAPNANLFTYQDETIQQNTLSLCDVSFSRWSQRLHNFIFNQLHICFAVFTLLLPVYLLYLLRTRMPLGWEGEVGFSRNPIWINCSAADCQVYCEEWVNQNPNIATSDIS